MKQRILLMEPIIPDEDKWGSFAKEKGVNPSIGLFSMLSYLKNGGFDVTFWDFALENSEESSAEQSLRIFLEKENFDIIGIPVFTNTALHSFSSAKIVKEVLPQSLVIFGGVHISSTPQGTLEECPYVDIGVIGEGEYILEEIIEKFEDSGKINGLEKIQGIAYRSPDGIQINPERKPIKDLDSLPSIFEYFPVDKYVPTPNNARKYPAAPFMAQRGCPFSCSFCEVHMVMGKKVVFKSPEYVVDEFRMLKEKYKVKSVNFLDSIFTVNKKYTLALCEALKKANLGIEWTCCTRTDVVDEEQLKAMKAAGCWQVMYGIESANDQSLKVLMKGGKYTREDVEDKIAATKKAGLKVLASFILGIPGEDEKMVWETIRFAKKLGPHIAAFYLPVPYPGSDLYQSCLKDGGIRKDADWGDYVSIDFDNPVYVNPLLGKEKMKELYLESFRCFYMDPNTWFRNLASIRSWSEVKVYLRGARALLGFFEHNKFFTTPATSIRKSEPVMPISCES